VHPPVPPLLDCDGVGDVDRLGDVVGDVVRLGDDVGDDVRDGDDVGEAVVRVGEAVGDEVEPPLPRPVTSPFPPSNTTSEQP